MLADSLQLQTATTGVIEQTCKKVIYNVFTAWQIVVFFPNKRAALV